jgi:hypothetical protein
MQIMTLVLYLLQVAGGNQPAPSCAELQRYAPDFTDTGEAGGSGSFEESARDRMRTATSARTDYVDERGYLEEQEFIARFNNLTKAIRDFVSSYQPGQIDVKKVKAVRKAMYGLEKSGWFRPQKED